MLSDPQRVQRERDALLRLHEVHRLMTAERNIPKLLEVVMDHAIALTRAERGFLILMTIRGMEVKVARNIGKAVIEHPQFKVSKGVIDEVVRTAQPVLLDSARDDTKFKTRGSVTQMELSSVACLPLRLGGTVIGVIYLDNRLRKGLFQPEDLLLMETFADQAASCIETARFVVKVSELEEEVRLLQLQLAHANQKLQKEVETRENKIKRMETKLRKKQT